MNLWKFWVANPPFELDLPMKTIENPSSEDCPAMFDDTQRAELPKGHADTIGPGRFFPISSLREIIDFHIYHCVKS